MNIPIPKLAPLEILNVEATAFAGLLGDKRLEDALIIEAAGSRTMEGAGLGFGFAQLRPHHRRRLTLFDNRTYTSKAIDVQHDHGVLPYVMTIKGDEPNHANRAYDTLDDFYPQPEGYLPFGVLPDSSMIRFASAADLLAKKGVLCELPLHVIHLKEEMIAGQKVPVEEFQLRVFENAQKLGIELQEGAPIRCTSLLPGTDRLQDLTAVLEVDRRMIAFGVTPNGTFLNDTELATTSSEVAEIIQIMKNTLAETAKYLGVAHSGHHSPSIGLGYRHGGNIVAPLGAQVDLDSTCSTDPMLADQPLEVLATVMDDYFRVYTEQLMAYNLGSIFDRHFQLQYLTHGGKEGHLAYAVCQARLDIHNGFRPELQENSLGRSYDLANELLKELVGFEVGVNETGNPSITDSKGSSVSFQAGAARDLSAGDINFGEFMGTMTGDVKAFSRRLGIESNIDPKVLPGLLITKAPVLAVFPFAASSAHYTNI